MQIETIIITNPSQKLLDFCRKQRDKHNNITIDKQIKKHLKTINK
jgi:hypothetical protein